MAPSQILRLEILKGTISPDSPLAGYPLFNATWSVVGAAKDAGHVLTGS